MNRLIYVILLFSTLSVNGAVYTTTAVLGTWDIGGTPGATDDIVINHNWLSYGGYGPLTGFSGTLTVNAGNGFRITGDFTTTGGTVIVKSGATFNVTANSSTNAASNITLIGSWIVDGNFTNDATAQWQGAGNLKVTGSYTNNGNVGNITLPVELISFDVIEQGNSAILVWSTASEHSNDYFEIQKSVEGYTFETIGTVNGQGFSNQIINYNYTVALDGFAYYRLKQVDYDGKFEYSKMVSLGKEVSRALIQVININGEVVQPNDNRRDEILIYLYKDGTTKKVIVSQN